MDLRSYLKKHKMKIYEMAEKLDIHPDHLSHVLMGDYKYSKKLARRVELVTNGEVTAEELLRKNKEDDNLNSNDK